jgi:hypothetical protein
MDVSCQWTTIFPVLAPDMEQVATRDSASLQVATGTDKEQYGPTSNHGHNPHMLKSRHKGQQKVVVANFFRLATYQTQPKFSWPEHTRNVIVVRMVPFLLNQPSTARNHVSLTTEEMVLHVAVLARRDRVVAWCAALFVAACMLRCLTEVWMSMDPATAEGSNLTAANEASCVVLAQSGAAPRAQELLQRISALCEEGHYEVAPDVVSSDSVLKAWKADDNPTQACNCYKNYYKMKRMMMITSKSM